MYFWNLESKICLPKAVGRCQDQLASLNLLPCRSGFPEYSNVETSPTTEDLPQCRKTGPERIQPKLASTFLMLENPSCPNFSMFFWWFQPIWKTCSSNWIISLGRDGNIEMFDTTIQFFVILDPTLLFRKRSSWLGSPTSFSARIIPVKAARNVTVESEDPAMAKFSLLDVQKRLLWHARNVTFKKSLEDHGLKCRLEKLLPISRPSIFGDVSPLKGM